MPIEFDDRGLRIIGCNVPGVSFYDDDGVLWHQIYLRDDNTLNVGGTIAETAGTAPPPETAGLNTAAPYIWTGAHSFMHTITAQDIVPQTADTYDLGAAGNLWRKAYISELETTMFTSNAIVVSGARQVWGHNAGVLAAHLSDTADTCDFGIAMTPGDFVEMRGYGQVEYFEVGDNVVGTVYKIGADGSGARDLDGSGANTWPSGTPFLVLGNSGDGRVEIDADGPRISIFEQGVTYDANTERVRIGNMRNLFGTGANDRWGIGIGDYAGGNYLSYNAEEADGFILKSAGGAVVMDDTGIGGYAGGVTQWHAGTDGVLYAGAGNVTLDASGISVAAGTGFSNKLKFYIGGDVAASIECAPDVAILDIYADELVQLITDDGVALNAVLGDIRINNGLYVGEVSIDPAPGTITSTDDMYAGRVLGLQQQADVGSLVNAVLGHVPGPGGAAFLQCGWLGNSRQVFGHAATAGVWTEVNITRDCWGVLARGGPFINLNGSTQYLTIADAAWNEVGAYNLVAWWWVNAEVTNVDQAIIGKMKGTDEQSWLAYLDHTAGWTFVVSGDGAVANRKFISSTHSVTAGRWTFVGVMYKPSSSIRIYVGDINDSSLTVTENTTSIPASLYNGTADLRLGATSDPGLYWDGMLGVGVTRVAGGTDITTYVGDYMDYIFKSTKYKYGG